MSIQSEITRINTEVSTQSNLLAQIKSALEGKAAGGSGGGGTSVETCTGSIYWDIVYDRGSEAYIYYIGRGMIAQSVTLVQEFGDESIEIEVVKGSIVCIVNCHMGSTILDGLTLLGRHDYTNILTVDRDGFSVAL